MSTTTIDNLPLVPVAKATDEFPVWTSLTTLAGNGGGITFGATTMLVASSVGAPSTSFYCQLESETILVTNIVGLTWTITRGQNGTTPAAHSDGITVQLTMKETAAQLASYVGSADIGGSSGQLEYNNAGVFAGMASSAVAATGDLLTLTAGNTTDIPLVVKGVLNKTTSSFEVRNSLNTAYLSVGPYPNTAGNAGVGNMVSITGTLAPCLSSSAQIGLNVNMFGPASDSGTGGYRAAQITMNAGYTGANKNVALIANNFCLGTGGALSPAPLGNFGISVQVANATTGYNFGGSAVVSSGNINVGWYGRASTTTAAGVNKVNIGHLGVGFNIQSGATQIGGFFYLGSTEPTTPPSAALIADIGTQTSPVFIGRINNVNAYQIDNNCGITQTIQNAATIGNVIKGAVNQTAHLLECQDSTGAVTVSASASMVAASATSNYLMVQGVIPDGGLQAVYINPTSSGVGATGASALNVNLAAGYTGAGGNQAIFCTNNNAGTGVGSLTAGAGAFNSGIRAGCVGVGVGITVGVHASASGSTTTSVGVVARAVGSTANTNIGVFSQAISATHTAVAGYFGLLANNATIPTFVPSVLQLDNGATTSAILVGQVNGTTAYQIDNNCGITQTIQNAATIGRVIKGAASHATDFLQLQDSTGTRFLSMGFGVGVNAFTVGTPPANANIFNMTAFFPSAPTTTSTALQLGMSTAGSANFSQNGIIVNMFAGYTGVNAVVGVKASQQANGQGASIISRLGNYGGQFLAGATTNAIGYNIGVLGSGGLGLVNIGVVGQSKTAAASQTNIGLMAQVRNTGGGGTEVGLLVRMADSDPSSWTTSAGILCDIAAEAVPIFIGQVNSVTAYQIDNNAGITQTIQNAATVGYVIKTAASATADTLQIQDSSSNTYFRVGSLGSSFTGSGFHPTDTLIYASAIMPASPATQPVAYSFTAGGAGTADLLTSMMQCILFSGYTGPNRTQSITVSNQSLGTGASIIGRLGNFGIFATGGGTANATGYNVGGFFSASNGLVNAGVVAQSKTAAASKTNVGLMAQVRNTGASGTEVGLLVRMADSDPAAWTTSAGIICDVAAETIPILLGQKAGVTVAQIDNNGNYLCPHVVGTTAAPAIAAGAGAGTSPTVSVIGSDMAGQITVTTGTLPGSGVVVTITFTAAYTAAPYICLTPANADTALLSGATMVYITSTTTTFVINAGATGLTASTTYLWNYLVVG